MAWYGERYLDEESEKFLTSLGATTMKSCDEKHSIKQFGEIGLPTIIVYMPLDKKCTTIAELLIQVRDNGRLEGRYLQHDIISRNLMEKICEAIQDDSIGTKKLSDWIE